MGVAELVTGIERGCLVPKTKIRADLEEDLGHWAYREQQAYFAYQAIDYRELQLRRDAEAVWHKAMMERARAYAALVKHLKGTPPPTWNEKWEPGDG